MEHQTQKNHPASNQETIIKSSCQPTACGFKLFLLVLILILVGALIYGASWALQIQKRMNSLAGQQSILSTRFSDLNGLFQAQSETAQNQLKALGNYQATLDQLKQTIGSNQSWVLAEVDYLLHTAQFDLTIQHQIPQTILLLKAADDRLNALHDAKTLALRDQLAKMITDLSAIPIVDKTGIYLQLKALDDTVDQLPLIQDHLQFSTTQNHTTPIPASIKSKWLDLLHTFKITLKEILIIRHHEQPIEPLMTDQYRDLLNIRLHVLFAEAEWATLNEQTSLYQSILNQLQTIFQHYFIQTDAKLLTMQQTLHTLQPINFSPTLPDLTPVLEAFQKLQSGK
ncbi:MAG: hypothetical protein A2103_03445 [Gammaproteobacteria bacterium GWF2_41_13]|nr:MAG: hypothetical protein A2103_03445 [Gammaproteobacteria bacterium GWF2_41_13]